MEAPEGNVWKTFVLFKNIQYRSNWASRLDFSQVSVTHQEEGPHGAVHEDTKIARSCCGVGTVQAQD